MGSLGVSPRIVGLGQESVAQGMGATSLLAPEQVPPAIAALRESFMAGMQAGSLATAAAALVACVVALLFLRSVTRSPIRYHSEPWRSGVDVTVAPAAPAGLMRLSAPTSGARLLCLPYAGGRADGYRRWSGDLVGIAEVWAADLPGRHRRTAEPLVTDPEAVVAAISTSAQGLLDRPLAVFGHSMGALLAFEVVRELERRDRDVLALIVSGCAAPHLRATRTQRGPRTDAELVAQLRSWGGTPAELLEDPDLMALALRPLRADLALCDRYRPGPGGVEARMTALAGTDDVVATLPEVEAWAGYSTRWRGVHVIAGGHFFVHAAGRAVVDVVAGALRPE